MADYNQSLCVPEAVARISALDAEGIYWIEEPTRADDLVGHAQIASTVKTAIQLGENWWGAHDMLKSITARASDYVMLDAMKIGGVTGWMRASAIAEAQGLPVSSHLFPEISAHLLANTPTAHWLEYLDIASAILQSPLHVEQGYALPSEVPGTGITWNEEAVKLSSSA